MQSLLWTGVIQVRQLLFTFKLLCSNFLVLLTVHLLLQIASGLMSSQVSVLLSTATVHHMCTLTCHVRCSNC